MARRFLGCFGPLLILASCLFPASAAAEVSGETNFYPSRSGQTFVVPQGVYTIRVLARGASGAQVRKTGESGHGAVLSGGFAVTPGEVLQVYVADNDAHGYGTGGNHGEVAGSAHDGARGGGASAVVSSSALVIAGGGGGGGGDNAARGGVGGDAGTPGGLTGGFPNFVQSWDGAEYVAESIHPGCGGCEGGGDGGKGDDDFSPDDAGGGGGGGGGGINGGAGGQHGYTFRIYNGNFEREITEEGGAGGGGGSSYIRSDAIDPNSAVDTGCTSNGTPSSACEGFVNISWGAPPAAITTISGNGQGVPLTSSFEPIELLVTDGYGLPVTAEPITFTVPGSGPSGVLPGGGPSLVVETDDAGIARLFGLAPQGPVGPWTLTASAPSGVTAGISLTTQAIPTEVAPLSTPNPATTTERLEISARVVGTVGETILPPTGAVQFAIDGNPLGTAVGLNPNTGTAQLPAGSAPFLAAGAHTITADYLGDAAHAPENGRLLQEVFREETAVSVEGAPNPVSDGSALDLRATLSARTSGPLPTGTVSFESDGNVVGAAPVEGGEEATLHLGSLPLGPHEITALYSGDARFEPGRGEAIEVVDDAAVAAVLSSSANPSTFGSGARIEAEIVRAEAGPDATGTVDFAVDGNTVCADVQTTDAVAACDLPSELGAGEHKIRASFDPAIGSGDAAATGAMVQLVVQSATTDALAATPTAAIFGRPFALASTVLRDDGVAATGSVRFGLDRYGAAAPVALVSGRAELADACSDAAAGGNCPLGIGVHTVTSEFIPADENLRFSLASGLVHVDPEPTRTGVRLAAAPPGPSASFLATVTAPSGAAEGAVQFLLDGKVTAAPVPLVNGVAASPSRPLAPGPHLVVAHYLGAERFEPSEAKLGLGAGGGAAAGTTKLRLLSREALVAPDGTTRIRVACDGERGGTCAGNVYLRLPAAAAKGGPTLVARAHLELASGSSGTSLLSLRRSARGILSRQRTLATMVGFGGEKADSRLRLRTTPAPLLIAEAVHRRYRSFVVRLRCLPSERSGSSGCEGVVELSADGARVGTARVSALAAGPISARIRLPKSYADGADAEVTARVRSQVAVGVERLRTTRFDVRPRALGPHSPAR